ncbi:MAG: YabP/YqfC family sporulation protein [Clostridia bacterium]|nr:YabP/YqfC family sporulation protein [Clostridia bacterium]
MSAKRKKNLHPLSEESNERCPLPEWLAVRLDIPADMLEGGLCVELRGRNTLLVRGCQRILHYAPDLIKLQMKGSVLNITGARMICHSYLAGAVGVEGKVNGICFEDDI